MTEGEKMVWAAVYAKKRDLSNRPSDCIIGEGSDERWRQWEEDQTVSAIEHANYAVQAMREALPAVIEGYGEDDDTTRHLKDMLRGR